METPSSTRRVTRSQTLAAAASNGSSVSTLRKIEESEKGLTKSRQRTGKQQDRSALIDITNDSPIVGLAIASLETPSSTMSKKRINITPGSGEALLRGQVKTLLQKVEEEAELSKLSLEQRPLLHLHTLVNSPMGLIAPTPANTPQILNLCDNGSSLSNGLASVSQSPVEDKFMISQMVTEIFEGKKHEGSDESDEKSFMITRSLLSDFSEKSDSSECSSGMAYEEGLGESEGKQTAITAEDDDASIWSIQVNASTRDDQEEEDEEEALEEFEEEYDNNEYYSDGHEEEKETEEGGSVDELCEGISKISVNGNGEKTMAKFAGKHTRFLYNSDDELEEEEVCGGESESSALNLKGLPAPRGKHIRFPEELDVN